ncbi:MAG: P22 phage major capsid protein family protein [Pseudomonadota bacterium]
MAGNSLLTIDMITREAVRLFKNSNLFIMNMDTQYDPQFAIDGAKIGSTLRIRLPNDYIVTSGTALQLQSTTEQYTTLTVTDQRNVAVPFTSAERTMSIDDYSEIVLAPMINNLAGKVAQTVMTNAAASVANFTSNKDNAVALNAVSATGAIISPTSEQFLQANAILDDNSADQMTRRVVNDPTTDARTTVSLQGLFNPTPEISAQFRTGMMKSGLGYERWFRDQTVVKHTSGTFSAGGTLNGVPAQGATSITVNAITGTLKKGDIITIAGVNAVNRVTKQDLGTLRQFVVTADVATTGTTINIYPALVTPQADGTDSQYQTVASIPADAAQVKLVTQSGEVYRKSIAYVQKAITLATADLIMVKNAVVECARANYDGISMRILTDYINTSDQIATRADVLFGSATLRGEWLCAVADRV